MLNEKNTALNGMFQLVMAFMILYYVPVTWFLARQNSNFAVEEITENWETGMGGWESDVTMSPVSLEQDQMLSEPEPEDFSRPRMLLFTSYTVKQGDVLGKVAKNFGLNTGTLISLNGIKNTRFLRIGQTLRVSNQDGVYYRVKKAESLAAIAEKHKADANAIIIANELFSDQVNVNKDLFIPGATMAWEEPQEVKHEIRQEMRQEVYGDLFLKPVQGRFTSGYGYRRSPFNNTRSFHNGLDIAAVTGTPIIAAMAGMVKSVGFDNTFGNYVVIDHLSTGYTTLYGHMSEIHVRAGTYVEAGDRIGDVGSTGQSTGPHVHFTVYKDGATVNPRNLIMR
jgi:murein DD-endopeptidase MepM/ murein hydrolase activator NlpD